MFANPIGAPLIRAKNSFLKRPIHRVTTPKFLSPAWRAVQGIGITAPAFGTDEGVVTHSFAETSFAAAAIWSIGTANFRVNAPAAIPTSCSREIGFFDQ
jgi:hypothetical protein